MNVLVIGYGNPGRLDDGLGPALAQAIESEGWTHVTVDSDYQLSVEDSAEVAKHDVVIFVDADVACEAPFTFERIEPASEPSFSSHHVKPEYVLGMARQWFDAQTEGYVLAIRGYVFNEFGECLSSGAQSNLHSALAFLRAELSQGCLCNTNDC